MYHPHDFKPTNKLVFEFNSQEIEEEGVEPILKKIKEALTTKKEEYMGELECQYIVRGVFEKITNKENKTIENKFGIPILDKENKKYDIIEYMDYVVDEEDDELMTSILTRKYI